MPLRNILLAAVFSLFFCPVFAGSLLSQEAVNYYNEGVQAQKGGDFSKAGMSYQKTMLVDPSNIELQKGIFNNLGIMFAQQGNLEEAERYFRKVIEMDPGYKPAQMNLGLIYDKTKSRLDSLEYWSSVFNWESHKPKDFIIEEGSKKTPNK